MSTDLPATARPRAPGVMLWRLSGSLQALLTCGVARRAEPDVIELLVDEDEAAQGGMVTISMPVDVETPAGVAQALFSAWLAIPPGVSDVALLAPSVPLRGMLRPVSFRIRIRTT